MTFNPNCESCLDVSNQILLFAPVTRAIFLANLDFMFILINDGLIHLICIINQVYQVLHPVQSNTERKRGINIVLKSIREENWSALQQSPFCLTAIVSNLYQ